MKFPLAQPLDDVTDAMEKSWGRVDLQRYLQRWERSPTPTIPPQLLTYSWRGLDIGCGFGKYLLQQSEEPSRGFLGIDKGSLRGGQMLRRFADTKRTNLFGIHGNVTPVLAGFDDELFDEVTIFYPNPWWPTKHRKKRWSFHPILPKMVSVLKVGGTITLTSNEEFYLGEWLWALQNHPATSDQVQLEYAGPIQEETGRTHFETKFIQEQTDCGEVRFKRIK